MKMFRKIISLSLVVMMFVSVSVSTTVFAGTTFTNPSIWFDENFTDATVGDKYSCYDTNKMANKSNTSQRIVGQDSDGNKYLTIKSVDNRIGNPNNTAFGDWLGGRGASAYIFEFDIRLKTMPTDLTNSPKFNMRNQSQTVADYLVFGNDGVYYRNEKIDGLSFTADEWIHISYVKDCTGLRHYVNDTCVYTTAANWVLKNIFLDGSSHHFDLDNVKVYGFTDDSVSNAVAAASRYRSVNQSKTTARLDVAVDALIAAENTSVENNTTATAGYANEIAKVNTIIEQYKKAAIYEKYKNDPTLGAEVTELIAAVDDTRKTDEEIAAMFAALDSKLEVVATIDEAEQYIAENASVKDTSNLSYVLGNLKNAKESGADTTDAVAYVKKVLETYRTPSTSMMYSDSFYEPFSGTWTNAPDPNSGTLADGKYTMSAGSSLAWNCGRAFANPRPEGNKISSGIVTAEATLNFSTNDVEIGKAMMISSVNSAGSIDRDIPVLSIDAGEDGYLRVRTTYDDNYGVEQLCPYEANTDYKIRLIADLDIGIGMVYVNGTRYALDKTIVLRNVIVGYPFAARCATGRYTIDDVLLTRDVMWNKIDFSDKDGLTEDVLLPGASVDGYPIRWSTSNAAVITSDGKVTVPASGSAEAVLTADVLCGEKAVSYSYAVNVNNFRSMYRYTNFTVGGKRMSKFTNGDTITMTVNFTNTMPEPQSARCYLSVYNTEDGSTVDVVNSDTFTVAPGDSDSLSCTVTIPSTGTYRLKSFVWDGKLKSHCVAYPIQSATAPKYAFLAIGQSNMVFRGKYATLSDEQNDNIDLVFLTGSTEPVERDGTVVNRETGADWNWAYSSNTYYRRYEHKTDGVTTGMGPQYRFGVEMQEYIGEPIGMINGAIPGLPIESFTKDRYSERIYGDCYTWLLNRVKRAQQDGTEIIGIIWLQGENNAIDGAENANKYKDTLVKLLNDLIADANLDENIPIVISQLCTTPGMKTPNAPSYDIIQKGLADASEEVSNGGLITPPSDLAMRPDNMHFTGESYEILGKMYADEMQNLMNGMDRWKNK